MAYESNLTRLWDRDTPDDGFLFKAEFERIYGNTNFLKDAIDLNQLNLKGFANGRVFVNQSSPSVLSLAKWSRYDVNGKLIVIQSALSIDFAALTNLFQSDGSVVTSVSQVQNKQLYVLLTENGELHSQVIESALLPSGSHSYFNNPQFIKDYYANTPLIFDSAKNGYYKTNKRIIAIIRVNGSSNIEFFYNLGFGHRFQDVENIAIGQTFTETRWKREHPACYIPDGATVAAMSTEAPELYQIYGSNVLPDWKDRFERNIDFSSSRIIRDTQEDMYQEHYHEFWSLQSIGGTGTSIGSPDTGTSPSLSLSTGENVVRSSKTDGVNGAPRNGQETRPKNYTISKQIVKG